MERGLSGEHVLCYLFDGNEQVGMVVKKCGYRTNTLTGYGGRINDNEGETAKEAALRTLSEQCGIEAHAAHLVEVLLLTVITQQDDGIDPFAHVHVFRLTEWTGTPKRLEGMGPIEWFSVMKLPFKRMTRVDRRWLPALCNSTEQAFAEIRYTLGSLEPDFQWTPDTRQ